MFSFLCSHPSHWLGVEKEQTIITQDEDFNVVIYHFICYKCFKKVKIEHAKMIGGPEAYLERGKKKYKLENL